MRADRRSVMRAAALLGLSAWAPVAAAGRVLSAEEDKRIKALIGQMTLAEKLGQMTQLAGGRQKALNSRLDDAMLARVRRGEIGSFLHVAGAKELRALQRVAVEESRLKIPLLFAMDVIHGYRTIVPVPLALAASFDPEVARRAARLAAEEAWAAGLHWTFTPMVDIARDPRWGRVVEGAGEDPYLGSRMAEAQVQGFQGDDLATGMRVMACAKHFAGYGAAEGGRDYDSANISDRELNEIYLPPFRAAARAGVGSFMTAFNDLNGVPMTSNAELVRGELRERWGYQGLVVSDWNAIRELLNHGVAQTPEEAAALALRAGVDMDMTSNTYAESLGKAALSDKSLIPLIDEAVGRILAAKARLGLFDKPHGFGDAAREQRPLDRATARELAGRTIVLLRNEGGVLPLAAGKKLALIGALADDASSALGSWRGRGQAADAVTLRAALGAQAEYAPGVSVRSDDVGGIPAAVEAAKRADVVLLAIGEDYDFTGEARSRSSLDLPGPQQSLIDAIKATGKPIVAILMGGRPLALEKALEGIPAVLQTWLLGIESGNAILDVLGGRVNPGAKLPIGMPRTTGQVPIFYSHPPSGRPANPDLTIDSARYHDVAIGPLFPFGHGLSYTSFTLSEFRNFEQADKPQRFDLSVQVTNTGAVGGEEVVQLYIQPDSSLVARGPELRGFARVALAPGETRTVKFALLPDQTAYWHHGRWVIAGGMFIRLGNTSAGPQYTMFVRIDKAGEGSGFPAAIPTKTEVA